MAISITAQHFREKAIRHSMGISEGEYLPAYIESVRIVNVNIEDWSVDAMGTVADKRFFDIQVMNPYFHYANGEGIYVMPEVGAYAWLCFPSTGRMATPFILGFQAPFDESNISYRCNRQSLNPGDIMLRTRDENFVVLRRGGVLQIGATPTCQTMYVPIRNIIRNFCENFELNAFGGDLSWSIDRTDQTTTGDAPALWKLRAKEKSSDPGHIAELSIGSHGANNEVTLELIVRESGLNDAKTVCTLQVTKGGDVIWSAQKDFMLTVEQNINVTTNKGSMSLASGDSFTATSKKDMSIKSLDGEAIMDGSTKATVKSSSQVVISAPKTCLGGAGAKEPVIKGQELIKFLSNLITAISGIQDSMAAPTTAVAAMTSFPAQLSSLVSSKVFTE